MTLSREAKIEARRRRFHLAICRERAAKHGALNRKQGRSIEEQDEAFQRALAREIKLGTEHRPSGNLVQGDL